VAVADFDSDGELDLAVFEGASSGLLDALTAVLRSAAEGRRIELTTTVRRPEPVPLTPATDWQAWR